MRGRLLLFQWALAATALRRAVPTCVNGVHMIVARGSGEPEGLGRIASVVNNVTLAIPGSDYTAIDYPATIVDYPDSVAEGTAEFHRLIREYTEACPDTKVALLGYSQGAHALMDTVCGSDQDGFEPAADLADAFKLHIIAIVAFGDPTHIVSAPWNQGTSKKDGLFPRPSIAGCEPYSTMIRGYCDTGDVYCDLGTDRAVHGSYFAKYVDDAVEFIAKNFEKANASPSETPTGIATSSTTTSVTTPVSSKGGPNTAAPTGQTASPVEPTNSPSTTDASNSPTTSVPSGGTLIGPSASMLIITLILSVFA